MSGTCLGAQIAEHHRRKAIGGAMDFRAFGHGAIDSTDAVIPRV